MSYGPDSCRFSNYSPYLHDDEKNSVPSHVALPLTAALVYGIKLIYFGHNPNLINATVVNGLLTAWTPILIIWGAILLFKTMEHSGGMVIIRAWLNAISNKPHRATDDYRLGVCFFSSKGPVVLVPPGSGGTDSRGPGI